MVSYEISCHVKCAILSVLTSSVSLCLCATELPPLDAQGSFLWRWLTFLMSRSGVYLTLVTLITFNFLAKAFKDKMGTVEPTKPVSDFNQPHWQNIRDKWKHQEIPIDIQNSYNYSDDDTDSIKERLREAEMTMAALKAELEETQRTKMTLENSLEELEKDRSSSEDELMKTRMAGALKMENLKKENASLERQLERTKADVEALSREVEILQREARISESALRDQQSLSERLEATRSELDEVKAQLKGIKIERDTAVRLASEQIYKKMTSDGSVQRRELIEEMIDMELKRVREEEEALNERGQDLMVSQSVYIDNNDSQMDGEPTTSYPPVHSIPLIHRNAVGDAPACTCPDETYNITTETSTYSNLDRTVSTSDDCTDEDSERPHIVTGSPAFRAFLRSNFGAPA